MLRSNPIRKKTTRDMANTIFRKGQETGINTSMCQPQLGNRQLWGLLIHGRVCVREKLTTRNSFDLSVGVWARHPIAGFPRTSHPKIRQSPQFSGGGACQQNSQEIFGISKTNVYEAQHLFFPAQIKAQSLHFLGLIGRHAIAKYHLL